MGKRPGILWEDTIEGCAKELPDFDYPIPDQRQNQYELDRLFTHSFDRELRNKNEEESQQ